MIIECNTLHLNVTAQRMANVETSLRHQIENDMNCAIKCDISSKNNNRKNLICEKNTFLFIQLFNVCEKSILVK